MNTAMAVQLRKLNRPLTTEVKAQHDALHNRHVRTLPATDPIALSVYETSLTIKVTKYEDIALRRKIAFWVNHAERCRDFLAAMVTARTVGMPGQPKLRHMNR